MELHHFHIAEFETSTQRHGEAIHRLITAWGVVLVHGWTTAGAHQNRLGTYQFEAASPHVDHQYTPKRRAVFCRDQTNGAMLLQFLNTAGEDLFHQAIDNLDAC